MLDVILFGALKKHAHGLKLCDEEQPTAAFLLKVYHEFKQTMTEVNIWGASSAMGFSYDITQKPYELLFDEEKFRHSRGFLELWERDVPFESLSRRRQQAMFEWINQPEEIDMVHIFCFFGVGKQRYATGYLIEKVANSVDLPDIFYFFYVFQYQYLHSY
jgi:hypothetical protein